MQHNPLVCRDHGQLVKFEETALLGKRDTNEEDSRSCINAGSIGSIKVPKEHAINILREIEGKVIIHKT